MKNTLYTRIKETFKNIPHAIYLAAEPEWKCGGKTDMGCKYQRTHTIGFGEIFVAEQVQEKRAWGLWHRTIQGASLEQIAATLKVVPDIREPFDRSEGLLVYTQKTQPKGAKIPQIDVVFITTERLYTLGVFLLLQYAQETLEGKEPKTLFQAETPNTAPIVKVRAF